MENNKILNTKNRNIYESLSSIIEYVIERKHGDLKIIKTGFVDSIDESNGIIKVDSNNFIYDVNIDINDISNITLPELNSLVHFYNIDNIFYLLKSNKITRRDYITDVLNVNATEEINIVAPKITIKNEELSLLKILTDLIDALQKMTVTTPVGPSGTVINATDFNKVSDDLKKLFKE